MNANELVINTEGLSKSFGEVHALRSLDLHVPQKSIFAFPGPNGAGKTTYFKIKKPHTCVVHFFDLNPTMRSTNLPEKRIKL